MSASVIQQIRTASHPPDTSSVRAEVRAQLDAEFVDFSSLLGQNEESSSTSAPAGRGKDGRKRERRGLREEIAFWECQEAEAVKELEETGGKLSGLLEETQSKLQAFLSEAQGVSIQRYALADKLAHIVSDLAKPVELGDGQGEGEGGWTLLQEMEGLQEELARLEAGLAWASVLEQALVLSEKTLAPTSHIPSPVAALPHYRALHELVEEMKQTLPEGMALLALLVDAKERTWAALKEIMSKRLLDALEKLKWPLKVTYPSVPSEDRRSFERTFQDLLYLQAEGEALHGLPPKPPHWSSNEGLYPLQAMVQPIALRFKYHFQGSRSTNRVDKPEWAFANILDQIYEQQSFLEDYLQPLAARASYADVDVKSEFVLLLFPILLSFLLTRMPKLLDHPALLAHTIYQAVVFDDAIRAGDFDISRVSIYEGVEGMDWEGLTGVLLKEEGLFQQWLAGEKKFVDEQLQEIISSQDAWKISDEPVDYQEDSEGRKPTVSSRQIKSLMEQVTDRYAPLPTLEHRLPFLTSIQLPTLMAYHSRISGSLDAFETLSSAFVRAVPGALSGNTRGGVHVDSARLTGGVAGLERLIKAGLSAGWVLEALRRWSDNMFFVEMSAELRSATHLRWNLKGDPLIPAAIIGGSEEGSVFDVVIERYTALCQRAEDMLVRLVTVEVENDLKQHLTRSWDIETESEEPDASLLNARTTFSTLLQSMSSDIPPVTLSRLYRRIVSHLSNHIQQRVVYSGWSRFSVSGGQSFYTEISDWIHTATAILKSALPPANVDPGAPWSRLSDVGKVLRLPTDNKQGEPTFAQGMAAAWSDGEESLRLFVDRVEVEMGREELQGVLRRRVECWR